MYTLKTTLLILTTTLLLVSCLSKEEKMQKAEEEGNTIVAIKSKFAKGVGDALKKEGKEASESLSEGVGEVVKGTSSGIDKSINQARVSALDSASFHSIFNIGRTEKYFNEEHKTKKVTIYLICNKDFKGKVKLKAYDSSQNEIGRSTIDVQIKEDEAQYFDFAFDNRTPLLQADFFTIETK
ncbi:MAG TPA: hypothetical protein VL947_03815 [Cytophagales bacterium]|nr:hypothetical protein [Cytophagales bacterium]